MTTSSRGPRRVAYRMHSAPDMAASEQPLFSNIDLDRQRQLIRDRAFARVKTVVSVLIGASLILNGMRQRRSMRQLVSRASVEFGRFVLQGARERSGLAPRGGNSTRRIGEREPAGVLERAKVADAGRAEPELPDARLSASEQPNAPLRESRLVDVESALASA